MYRVDVRLPSHKTGRGTLIVDGKIVPSSNHRTGLDKYMLSAIDDGKHFDLSLVDDEFMDRLTQIKLREISPEIDSIYPYNYVPDGLLGYEWKIADLSTADPNIYLLLTVDDPHWNKPWSLKEFSLEISRIAGNMVESRLVGHDGEYSRVASSIAVKYPISDRDSTIMEEFEKRLPEVKKLVEETEKSLRAKLDENVFVGYFNFPEGLQGACEEYLWSFIQFLREVGVDANGGLEQDRTNPGKVLFTVAPQRGKAVLGKVKQALELYIHLAGASNFEFDAHSSIASDMLQSRVLYFQSQFQMAQAREKTLLAEIRAQEAETRAKGRELLAQQAMLERVSASNVFLLSHINSLESEKAKKSAEEISFLGGIGKIGDYRKGPFAVNIPRLLVWLKLVMPDDSITTLPSVDLMALPPSDTPALPQHDDSQK